MNVHGYNPFQRTKPAEYYTPAEIALMLQKAKRMGEYYYDYLIDRLYLYDPDGKKRNTKNKMPYSYLTARQEQDRRKRENGKITQYI